MDIVLYELAGADPAVRFSPHCWKVRMALAHKGLKAEGRPWRFTDREAIAFSAQERVPVLIDHGEVVADSWRIAQHLEARHRGAPSLFEGGGAAALAGFVNAWADGALAPAIARLILIDVYDCLDAADRDYFRTSRESRYGQTLETVVADRPAHLAALSQVLTPLRLTLNARPFLCGAAPGYADYCVFGMFMWARCTSTLALIKEDDPIFAWRERLLSAYGGLAGSAPSARR